MGYGVMLHYSPAQKDPETVERGIASKKQSLWEWTSSSTLQERANTQGKNMPGIMRIMAWLVSRVLKTFKEKMGGDTGLQWTQSG
jgi:hypothetical protein